MGRRIDWEKVGLSVYFCIFLLFMYLPMIVMAILSLQGPRGNITFPIQGFGFQWWEALVSEDAIPRSNAERIRDAAAESLQVSIIAGLVVALLALGLSMAFRRRFRGDSLMFTLILLALMTPGALLSLGTVLFWDTLGSATTLWKTALGVNVTWALPFGFLVMVAVWNRYDISVEEAAADLGASKLRTFWDVTLPLVWTGLFGCFLFGFTLSWNEFDRNVLILAGQQNTLPVEIFAIAGASFLQPDFYALGTATTLFVFIILAILIAVAFVFGLRRRGRRQEEDELTTVDVEEAARAGARTS